MTCRRVRKWLSPYHDGELPPGKARRVEEHLLRCAGCREVLRRLSQADHAAAVPDPGPAYWDKMTAGVLGRVDREAGASPGPARVPRIPPPRKWTPEARWASALAAAMVLVVAGGMITRRQWSPEVAREAIPLSDLPAAPAQQSGTGPLAPSIEGLPGTPGSRPTGEPEGAGLLEAPSPPPSTEGPQTTPPTLPASQWAPGRAKAKAAPAPRTAPALLPSGSAPRRETGPLPPPPAEAPKASQGEILPPQPPGAPPLSPLGIAVDSAPVSPPPPPASRERIAVHEAPPLFPAPLPVSPLPSPPSLETPPSSSPSGRSASSAPVEEKSAPLHPKGAATSAPPGPEPPSAPTRFSSPAMERLSPSSLYQSALASYENGRYRQAASALREFQRFYPRDPLFPRAMILLARSLDSMGQEGEAEKALAEAEVAAPGNRELEDFIRERGPVSPSR